MKRIFSSITVATGALLGLGLLLIWAAPFAHAGEKRVFTKHFEETLFDVTKNAEYSVEILLDAKEYDIGKDVIGIVIHNAKDHDVEKAAIDIDFRDLETGQPAPGKPVLNEKGGGLYTLSGLDLQREGRWKLTVTVEKDGLKDSVEFLFPEVLKKKWPAGRYNP
jgi:hypothetical protein